MITDEQSLHEDNLIAYAILLSYSLSPSDTFATQDSLFY